MGVRSLRTKDIRERLFPRLRSRGLIEATFHTACLAGSSGGFPPPRGRDLIEGLDDARTLRIDETVPIGAAADQPHRIKYRKLTR